MEAFHGSIPWSPRTHSANIHDQAIFLLCLERYLSKMILKCMKCAQNPLYDIWIDNVMPYILLPTLPTEKFDICPSCTRCKQRMENTQIGYSKNTNLFECKGCKLYDVFPVYKMHRGGAITPLRLSPPHDLTLKLQPEKSPD